MRVGLLTREFPPEVYGGAGVHVEHLARELRGAVDLTVDCWGAPRSEPGVRSHRSWEALAAPRPEAAALQAMSIDLSMALAVAGRELVHSHTWYANLAGHLAKITYGIPHVATTHSLEPLRPWKAEQLGGGYAVSCFCERTGLTGADAVIAVSEGMRRDVIGCYPEIDPQRVRVIHNGVDPDVYRPRKDAAVLERLGVDGARPYVLFVGRVTRQKGLQLLLEAAPAIPPRFQIVVAAGPADTPEIAREVGGLAERVRAERGGLTWIEKMLPRDDAIALYSSAAVFVCPSIYEPFGLVNLEAMACETAVVASRVGGIPEIVVDGETGFLVDLDLEQPGRYAAELAARVTTLLDDPGRAAAMGAAGRQRVLGHFSWRVIGERTLELYSSLL